MIIERQYLNYFKIIHREVSENIQKKTLVAGYSNQIRCGNWQREEAVMREYCCKQLDEQT